MKPNTFMRYLLKVAATAVVFWGAGRLGLALASASAGAHPIWSPLGVGVAGVLLLGYEIWPGIFLGAWVADFMVTSQGTLSPVLALGKTAECVLAAWFINRYARGCRFYERPWDVFKFALLAGLVSPLLSPPLGVAQPILDNYIFWAGPSASWLSCWLGEAASVVVLTPLLVLWHENHSLRVSRARLIEFALLITLLLAACAAIFGNAIPPPMRKYLMPNFCLPFLLWAALRFGPRETATATFLLGLAALWGTLQGRGYFARTSPAESLLVFQGFLAANAVVSLVVAALIQQRNESRRELQLARDDLEARVQQRTAELTEANQALQQEMARRQEAQSAHAEVLRQLVEVQEQERRRISRELHDQMGQDLAALKVVLGMLKAKTENTAENQPSFSRLEQLIERLMQTVRRLAWELRPAILDDFGLDVALQRYTQEWTELHGVPVDFHTTGVAGRRLPGKVETALYRIAQEALTNVSRHAKAGRVSVLLERRPGQLSLIVEDNGCGFDADATLAAANPHKKLGLLGMRERAIVIDGTVEVEAQPGQGTTVFVRVPLSEEPMTN